MIHLNIQGGIATVETDNPDIAKRIVTIAAEVDDSFANDLMAELLDRAKARASVDPGCARQLLSDLIDSALLHQADTEAELDDMADQLASRIPHEPIAPEPIDPKAAAAALRGVEKNPPGYQPGFVPGSPATTLPPGHPSAQKPS